MEAELKDKDAKFGAAQSRYKMSLRKLENANDDLRAAISGLEIENDKLKKQVIEREKNYSRIDCVFHDFCGLFSRLPS